MFRRSRDIALAAAGLLVLAAAILVATSAPSAGQPGRVTTGSAAAVFGVNMSLFDGSDQVVTDPNTQRLFASWGVPLIRVPMRRTLADATLTAALRAVRNIGATPLVILNGPGELADDGAILSRDLHDLDLVRGVFPTGPVELEYGNEDDLGHGVTAAQYDASWNTVISQVKAQSPAGYTFAGPVNFQSNPSYIGDFVRAANPRPDFTSWHEYVCQAADTSHCTANIAHWTTHAQNTNAAVQAAIGTTIPFLISEWNVDPANSAADLALYRDPAFIQPWTRAAISELRSLVPIGLAGALIYTASDHDAFGLVTAGPTLTPQGQTFAAELGTPPTSTTTTTTAPPPGTTVVSFEDGKDGWSPFFGNISAATTTQQAFDGSHSLQVTASGSNFSAVGTTTGVSGLPSGTQITYHVFATGTAGSLLPFVQDSAFQNHFVNAAIPLPSQPGWFTLTWRVPATPSVHAIGLQLNNPGGGQLTLDLDALTWPST
jgi:hypothetical protein